MPRSDLPTLDTGAFTPARPSQQDGRATERAEPTRPARRDVPPATDSAALEYCVVNDLI
jgi:hypothetical protein